MKFVPVPGTNVLFCTTETTVAQYQEAGLGYVPPAFPQGSNHPAVNVSRNKAKAWCQWLSRRDGKKYRLPNDAEWSIAVGPGTYPWGNSWPPPHNSGNYMGQETAVPEMKAHLQGQIWFIKNFEGVNIISGYRDRHVFTAPVSSYAADGNGLYDLGGNAWEWLENPAGCGGSWYWGSRECLTSSSRILSGYTEGRNGSHGFRCVVER
jgi:formylglycine-generating enzyme required for sulfatase activity